MIRKLKVLVAVVVLVAGGWGAWIGYERYRYDREHGLVAEAVARQDHALADERMSRCLALRPDHPVAMLEAARLARRADRLDEAEDLLHRLRGRAGAAEAEVLFERSLVLAQRGEIKAVQEYLEGCLDDRHPRSEEILESLAQGCVRGYHLKEAMIWLEVLLDRAPGNVTGRITRGLIFESMGGADRALSDYRHAVDAQPENSAARQRLGEFLVRRNEPAEAAEHLEFASRRRPTPLALLGLVRVYRTLNRPDEARAALAELLRRHPDFPDAVAEEGALALAEGDLSRARELLTRAVTLQPADRQARYHLAQCLDRLGDKVAAGRQRERMVEIEDDMKELEGVYGRMRTAPTDPSLRVAAGRICARNGQPEEALRWLHGALSLAPGHRPAHEALADFHALRGEEELARQHREKARR